MIIIIAALPCASTLITQLRDVDLEENGAVYDASDSENEIPM